MADEVVGLTGRFNVDTSQLTLAANQVNSASMNMAGSLGKINSESQKAGSGLTNLGGKMMVVGQFADDMQYGLRAVVNQIPMLVTAFGGGMGLAGAIGIVAVAANQLVNHWDDLREAFGSTVVLTKAQEMEKLAKATERTSAEQEKLNRYTREQKTIESQRSRRPEQENQTQNQVARAIGEVGADEIFVNIRRALEKSTAQVAESSVSAKMGSYGGDEFLNDPDIKRMRTRIRGELEKSRQESITQAARDLMANAESGPGVLGEQARKKAAELLGPGAQGDVFRNATDSARAGVLRSRDISIDLEEQVQREAIEEDQKRLDRQKAAAVRAENIAVDLETAFQMQAEEEANGPAKFGTKRARERDPEWDRLAGMDERGNDLNWKLRGLLNRSAQTSNSFGDADSYESSIKATSAEAQLKKLNDINEVLKDIKKNTEARNKMVERIAR